MHIDYAMLSMACVRYAFENTGNCAHFHLGYHTQWTYDQVTIVLAFNNNHIIYHNMDAQWSRALAWTYSTNPG